MKTIKLIVFDMDGVLFKVHNFWMEVHKAYGTYEEGKKLTDKYLLTDYDILIEEVVNKLWKGKPAEPYLNLIKTVKMYEGALETIDKLRKNNYIIAIITCGPKELMEKFIYDYGYCNELAIKNGNISGEFIWPVAEGREKKVQLLKEICKKEKITFDKVAAIADGKSDLEMLQQVGLPIAFCPTSEEIKKTAKFTVETPNLKEVLKILHL